MVVVRRAFFVVVLSLAVVGAISLLRGTGSRLTAQHTGGQWVAPDNPSDELVNGAYTVMKDWPKPLSSWPGHQAVAV